MSKSDPTLDEWRRLYEAALELKKQAPWEWMWEDEIFGVRNPETGEVGYVSIMGANGEHLCLAVYRGSEGLDGFWRMEHGELMEEPAFLLEIPQLQASFEDRDMVQKEDREVMKALGLKFRGQQAWPLFRSYAPGCAPWFLTAAEARFLAVAIEQALEVIPRLADDPELLEPPEEEGEYLVRMQTDDGWEDRWLSPEPVPTPRPPVVDMRQLEAMRQELPRQQFTLEAGLFALPTYIKDEGDARPYLPYHLMIVEANSGMIVGTALMVAKPDMDSVWQQTVVHFLDAIAGLDGLPQRIAVSSERLHGLLIPIAAGLGIRLQLSDNLPALDEARGTLEQWLGQRR
jgi:hypothetical protein